MLVMVRRHELSDAEWAVLSRLLPSSGTAGRPRSDDRLVLNGIVWKLRTGSAWRDVPERYGSWQTLYTRFRRWALDGTFSRMLRAVQAHKDAAGDIDWLVSVDSTVVRAHQHAAGGKRGQSTGTKRVITPWSIPGWTEHESPPGLRRARPPSRLRLIGRQRERLHPSRAGDGLDQRAQGRARASTHPA
jgi:transposase